jgi:hypothetical protein
MLRIVDSLVLYLTAHQPVVSWKYQIETNQDQEVSSKYIGRLQTTLCGILSTLSTTYSLNLNKI